MIDKMYQCPYERAAKCTMKDGCAECETFGEYLNGKTIPASPSLLGKTEEMNDNEKEIVSNVMRVLQDFYRRSDYELEQATGDIMNIFARSNVRDERFKMPTDKELIDIMLLFNGGKIQKNKLADMLSPCLFILDRLFKNGDIMKPSSKE